MGRIGRRRSFARIAQSSEIASTGTVPENERNQRNVGSRVKWFNDKKGYVSLKRRTRETFSSTTVPFASEGFRSLSEGDRVSFDVERGPKGPQAVNVKKLV